jgi:hypothetical protein
VSRVSLLNAFGPHGCQETSSHTRPHPRRARSKLQSPTRWK